ncbi:MAG: aminomethyl-transferring glycine dehydrogenase subunit GcvPA [Rickettsiales bacterium]|nr:aminomethyl-transferring glycine dehydrogenase subunit GcvPA [Rickettsiales bacterium]
MRYLALTEQDRKSMLQEIGVENVNQLFDAVPQEFLLKKPIQNLSNHLGEIEVEAYLKNLANKNNVAGNNPFFLGVGCYKHHIPATVDHLIQRSEFLTSYTPYQPEISQGTLATVFQFQSIISLLTGMEISNASMYDGATAMAEACLMALRIKNQKKKIALFGDIHPDYIEVTKTYLELSNSQLVEIDKADDSCSAIVVQYPNFYGEIVDLEKVRKKCDEIGALMIVVVNEILSLGLINPPSQADIVVGEASSIGVGLNFGGPLLGFFASKKEFVRQMPGRICGKTIDADGKEGYVLTLNAREQHIRREKATSNICSNQGLCATAFTIHSSLLGEIGFKKLALINHYKACKMAEMLGNISGIKILNSSFFNEFTIEFNMEAKIVNKKLLEENIIGGLAVGNKMIIAVTELTSDEDMNKLSSSLKRILS